MNKFLLTVVFFLLSVPYSISATIEPIYEDEEGKGFKDETPLTQEDRNFLLEHGNDAHTLGEARKNAFEYASSLLAGRLATDNTIRVSASFFFPLAGTEQNPCPDDDLRRELASGVPSGLIYFPSRLEEVDPSASNRYDRMFGVAYPVALAEAILGRELNGQEADISVEFNGCHLFAYPISRRVFTRFGSDFMTVVVHEIMHGLGFYSQILRNGSFSPGDIKIAREGTGSFILWEEGYTEGSSISLKSATIYDVQLYSRRDSKLLVNLSDSKREEAITSNNGLLWEGTDEGRNDCSYGQRMVKLQPERVRDELSDGKPVLAASPFNYSASVIHLNSLMRDLMEPRVSLGHIRENMDVSLGMLRDIGWEIDYESFPPSCVPSGVTTLPPSGVEVREGETAEFTVKLDSEPMSDVIIPLQSVDSNEVAITSANTLRFTTTDWNTPKPVTVTAATDDEIEATATYNILLGEVTSDDVFYQGLDPKDVPIFVTRDLNVSFEKSDYLATENDGNITLKVRLSPAQNKELVFNYFLRGINAYQVDHIDRMGQVSFAPGETESIITLGLVNDGQEEPEETFEVILLDQENSGIIDSAEVTIADDDYDELMTVWLQVSGCTENDWSICSSGDTVGERGILDIKARLSEVPKHDVDITILVDKVGASGSLTTLHFFSFADTEKTLSYIPIEDPSYNNNVSGIEISIRDIFQTDYSNVIPERDKIVEVNPSKISINIDRTETTTVPDPVEPMSPQDPVEPVSPQDPVEPMSPQDPVEPVSPQDPVEPVSPQDPVEPVSPQDPVEPVSPQDSTQSPPEPKTEISSGGGCSTVRPDPESAIFNNFFVFMLISSFVILLRSSRSQRLN